MEKPFLYLILLVSRLLTYAENEIGKNMDITDALKGTTFYRIFLDSNLHHSIGQLRTSN